MAWKNVQYENGKYRTSSGGGGGASEFADLDDVNFSNLQNGQIPKYNSTTQKWENANEAGGGGSVTDVEVDGVSVVNQQGVAEITMPTIPVADVEVNGASVVNQQGVAEITSYKEVTQAEYDALPASKLADGVLYCIKDAHGADGYPPLIYSDEEREVGVWRDGKPLYQKVFSGTYANGDTELDISWGVTGIQLVNMWGVLIPSDNPANRVIIGSNFDASNLVIFQGVDGSHVIIKRGNAAYFGSTPTAYVVCTYTKSSDTAGSGTWTTQGAYAHHYSTNERVVGTWIDGKPLYERVMALTLTNTSGAYDFSTDQISNIKLGSIVEILGDTFGVNTFASRGSSPSLIIYLEMSGANAGKVGGWTTRDDLVGKTFYCVVQYTKTTD